jgi:hypothetical protein
MEAATARCLHDRLEAVRRDRVADEHGDPRGGRESGGRPGIEVEHDRAGLPWPLDRPQVRMQLERPEIGKPDERGRFVDEAVPERLAATADDVICLDPVRAAATLCLEPARSVDALRISPEHHRATADVREQGRRDRPEILDEIALGRAGQWPQDAVEMAQGDVPPVDRRLDRHGRWPIDGTTELADAAKIADRSDPVVSI